MTNPSNRKITKEEYITALNNGIAPRTVRDRLERGYSKQQAITYPTHQRRYTRLLVK